MNWQVQLRSKTFWLNVAAICTAIGGYLSGELPLPGAGAMIVQALSNIFLRDGMTNPDKR